MNEKVLSRLLNQALNLDDVVRWIDCSSSLKKIDNQDEDLKQTTPEYFVHYVLSYVRLETQWFLRKREATEKVTNAEQKKGFSSSQNIDVSLDGSATKSLSSTTTISDSSGNTSKELSKLKLNSTPNSPGILLSALEKSFSASTPKRELFSSPLDSPDFKNDSPIISKSVSHSGNRSKNKGNSSTQEDKTKARTRLTLGDFIKPEPGQRKDRHRRINPTKILASPLEEKSGSSTFFQTPEIDSVEVGTREDRMLLKMDCESVMEAFAKDKQAVTPSKPAQLARRAIVKPNSPQQAKDPKLKVAPELVTSKESLDTFTHLYTFLLRQNYCENLMMELYFLFSILEITEFSECEGTSIFSNGSNCVYFAVQALSELLSILSILSAATISVLAANGNLFAFSQTLHKTLAEMARAKLAAPIDCADVCSDGNVSFQCDTDSPEHFTKTSNFSAFRKQRDEFYRLLKDWEKNQHVSALPRKVQQIIDTCNDPTNMVHLCRLFRSQLLTSCSATSLDESGKELQNLLPLAGRAKLSRLEARLTGSGPKRGPVPPPDFPGRQQFFHDFIFATDSGLFLHFLQLSLADELLKLNEVEFSDEANDVDEITRRRFMEIVCQSCLLAKFLAVAECQPYRGSEAFSANVLDLHCSLRLRTNTLFDLEGCFMGAWASHRLTLTVPWLVIYLSHMDRTSILLPRAQALWASLLALRRCIPSYVTPIGRLMMQLCLGWLFQVVPSQDVIAKALEPPDTTSGLDELDLISESCLYRVCPYLSELNAVLVASATAGRSRHIRPTPQFDPVSSRETAEKLLERRLEENFLQNQSTSTKRTIQFTAERVASCCVKYIIADIAPTARREIIERAAAKTAEKKKQRSPKPEGFSEIRKLTDDWERLLQQRCASTLSAMSPQKVEQSLRALFGPDLSESVVRTCCELTTRQVMEKVDAWLHSNILSDAATSQRFEELKKIYTSSQSEESGPTLAVQDFDPSNFPSTFVSTRELREISFSAMRGHLDVQQLHNLLIRLSACCTRESSSTKINFFYIVSDLLVIVAVSCPPSIATRMLVDFLKSLYDDKTITQNPFTRILCPRNRLLARQNRNDPGLVSLICQLLEAKFITKQNIEQQVKQLSSQRSQGDEEHQKQILLQLLREASILSSTAS